MLLHDDTELVCTGQVCHVRKVSRKIIFYDLKPSDPTAPDLAYAAAGQACPATGLELVCKADTAGEAWVRL